MYHYEISNPGPDAKLIKGTTSLPEPQANEVRIRITSIGLNRADTFQMDGSYPLPKGASAVPGLECAGTIEAIGAEVMDWQVGDKVMAITNGNSFASHVVTPAAYCLPLPENLSLKDAAALPEALFTLWMAMITMGELTSGESFFTYGGASGVGHLAIQIARQMDCPTFAGASSAEKAAFCEKLGATPVDYTQEGLVQHVKEANGGKGIDVLLDMAGGKRAKDNLAMMTSRGRITTIALMDGNEVELKLSHLLVKQLHWQGGMIRNRSDADKAHYGQCIRQHWLPWIAEGKISPVIFEVFALKDAQKAIALMQSGRHLGKILLTVDE